MFKLVGHCRKSGLSQNEFCKPQSNPMAKFSHRVENEMSVEKSKGFVHIPAQRSAMDNAYEATTEWCENKLSRR